MSDAVKIGTGLAIVVIIAAIGWWLFTGGEETQPAEPTPAPTAIPPSPTPDIAAMLSERLKGVTLATSDEVLRELVGALSERPELARWLASEDLIRRFVAAVDNVAQGRNPKSQLGFLRPEGDFEVTSEPGRVTIDPDSWERYDPIADVVTSVDPAETVTLFRELEPLMIGAHREISPPSVTFRDRFDQALDHLLATPVPDTPIEVERTIVTYAYVDPELEALSPAQRQLLRMGPANVQRVQVALRAFREQLEAAEEMAREREEIETEDSSPEM